MLLEMGIAPATRSNYRSAQRSFLNFCAGNCIASPIPASESLLCFYIAHISQTISHASARQHLFAIRALHIDLGYASPLLDAPRLDKVMTGLRREHGDSTRTKFPITTTVLHQLRPLLVLTDPQDRMLWAAMRLATCALLRTGEIAPDSPHSHRLLTCSDLSLERSRAPPRPYVARVRLKESKTDQFRKSVTVIASDQGTVQALSAYLVSRRPRPLPSAALFAHPDGTPLTRSSLLYHTRILLSRAGIDISAYYGISFRRGGATSLARTGAPTSVIQEIGRWKSDCYRRYIAADEAASVSAGLRMSP